MIMPLLSVPRAEEVYGAVVVALCVTNVVSSPSLVPATHPPQLLATSR